MCKVIIFCQITTYAYDERGRLTNQATGTIINSIEEYDKNNNIKKQTGPSGSQTYTYKLNGLLETQTSEDGKTASYQYDDLGRVTNYTDYFGKVTSYQYKENTNNLEHVIAGNNTVDYTYYLDSTLKSRSTNGTTQSYTYDTQNRVTQVANSDTAGATNFAYNYTYYPNGNVYTKQAKKNNVVTKDEEYTYDSLNRVKTISAPSKLTTYDYDENSNITEETTQSGPAIPNITAYTYDDDNRLTQTKTEKNDILDFTYDDNGNLISKMETAPIVTSENHDVALNKLGVDNILGLTKTAYYEYNELNQLTSYKDLNGVSETYSYNVNGLRNSKTYGGNTTKFYYNGDSVVNETKNGSLSATNIYGANGQAEIRKNQSGSTITDGYLFYDGHGDVTSVRDTSKAVIAEYGYDIYGKEESSTGTFENPIRYTGQYYDGETGMYYMRARFYDPDIRRFTSEDPAKDGVNWYAYCNGNPIALSDPSGLKPKDEFKSPEEAAKDFASYYFEDTQTIQLELGSLIYSYVDAKGNPAFSYVAATVGGVDSVNEYDVSDSLPKNTTVVATIHTHPTGAGGAENSDVDMKHSDESGKDSYVVGCSLNNRAEVWYYKSGSKMTPKNLSTIKEFRHLSTNERLALYYNFKDKFNESKAKSKQPTYPHAWPNLLAGAEGSNGYLSPDKTNRIIAFCENMHHSNSPAAQAEYKKIISEIFYSSH